MNKDENKEESIKKIKKKILKVCIFKENFHKFHNRLTNFSTKTLRTLKSFAEIVSTRFISSFCLFATVSKRFTHKYLNKTLIKH